MLILNKKDIIKHVKLNEDLIPIIEDAFKSLSKGKTIMPPIMRIDIEKYHGESDIKAAYIEGLDSFAIKIASGFFDNPKLGLPSSNGLMVLLDSETGVIKSVLLDEGYLTDTRTAIAGAIAAKYLSNEDASNLGIIGAGIQARLQLKAILLVRKINKINLWARDKVKVDEFIDSLKDLNIDVNISDSCKDLASSSDIIVTTTPSKKPLLEFDWIEKGTHITAMGSDAEQKNELHPAMIKLCDKYIPDNQPQTTILGELHHAIKENLIPPDHKFDDLGSIIIDPSLGRKNKEDITICDLTGTGVQDTAIARYTYNICKENDLGIKT
ncbi:cyclodeaminase [Pelagibacteraceae bacterium]|nr:cyclodeaminase [Pelagibacteraceae bacterium]